MRALPLSLISLASLLGACLDFAGARSDCESARTCPVADGGTPGAPLEDGGIDAGIDGGTDDGGDAGDGCPGSFHRIGDWCVSAVADRSLRGIHGTGADDFWVVGRPASLTHYSAGVWTDHPVPPGAESGVFFSVWTHGGGSLFIAGGDSPSAQGLWNRAPDGGWSLVSPHPYGSVTGVGDFVFAAGDTTGAQLWVGTVDGGGAHHPSDDDWPLSAVAARSATEAWAVGPNFMMQAWDGTVLTRQTTYRPHDYPFSAWASPTDVWAVGVHPSGGESAASVYRLPQDGGWSVVGNFRPHLGFAGVCGWQDEVWAVGTPGVVFRYPEDGGWQSVGAPTSHSLNAVWIDSAGGVWAVGDEGIVLYRPRVPPT